MPDPYAPPPGWSIISGLLQPDRSVHGYFARGQAVDGRCHLRDCRRTCHIDIKRIRGQGLGALHIAKVKELFQCSRLDGCALTFHDDLKAERMRVGYLTGRPGVAIQIRCVACHDTRAVAPATLIARLGAEGKGGADTEVRDLARLLSGACKACGKTAWDVQVSWPDPETWGGRRKIDLAKRQVTGPVDPTEF